MACPILLVNDETVWTRADDAAAGGNVRDEAAVVVAAGENVPALTVKSKSNESARALAAADGKALVLAGGVPAYAV